LQQNYNLTEKMSLLSERIKQPKFDNLAHEALLSLMVAVSQLKEKHNALCEEAGISYQHFNILRILKGVHPEGHPRCEISARMIDRSPDITRLIDKLVKEGLVKRTKSAQDMRQSVAVITAKGINLLEQLNNGSKHFANLFEKTIGEEDLKKLVSICDKILMIS